MWLLVTGVLIVAVFTVFKIWGGSSANKKSTVTRNYKVSKKASEKQAANHSVDNAYHAVSVNCDSSACSDARVLKDKNFLVKEAPTLPLKSCSATDCHCRYEHHEDRRSDEDRRFQFGVSRSFHNLNSERRERSDRRRAA